MTNGFYLQNFLYLYSRNKHVIMENTRIKLSETVMVIDAAYLNFVINDLKKYFEPLLGRSLQTVDLALFTMYLAMDAGLKGSDNDVQVLLVYDKQSGKLEHCLPSDLKNELDGVAFKASLGEFSFMAVPSEGFVSRGDLYLDLLQIVLNTAEVKKLIDGAFQRSLETLEKHRAGLTQLAELLLEREVIFAEDLEKIFGKRKGEIRKELEVKIEEPLNSEPSAE